MKKILAPIVISASMFLIAPSFAATGSSLYNPELRTDSTYSTGYSTLPKAGVSYAYWHHRHWNRWHRWHRGHHWHRWHHYHYW